MKLTRHQRIELIRLRRLKRRAQVKRRSLAQLGEHPVLTRDDGGSKPLRLTNDVPIAQRIERRRAKAEVRGLSPRGRTN